MRKRKQPEVKVRIVNPEAIPVAEINLAKAIAKILRDRQE